MTFSDKIKKEVTLEYLRNEASIERVLPEPLVAILLKFFGQEDHEEILEFLFEKLDSPNYDISIPGPIFYMVYVLLHYALEDIDDLCWEDLDKFLSGEYFEERLK